MNTRWGPGPVNKNLGPGPVNTNWGSGPGARARARDQAKGRGPGNTNAFIQEVIGMFVINSCIMDLTKTGMRWLFAWPALSNSLMI